MSRDITLFVTLELPDSAAADAAQAQELYWAMVDAGYREECVLIRTMEEWNRDAAESPNFVAVRFTREELERAYYALCVRSQLRRNTENAHADLDLAKKIRLALADVPNA